VKRLEFDMSDLPVVIKITNQKTRVPAKEYALVPMGKVGACLNALQKTAIEVIERLKRRS
jgi:hypothetical protein